MNEFVWEDPPKRHAMGDKDVWATRLALLKDRPGQWARVAEYPEIGRASTVAYQLRSGRVRGGAGFEFTGRTVGDIAYLYARYVGGDS